MKNPLDYFGPQESALIKLLLGAAGRGGYLAALRRVETASVEQAIRLKSAAPVLGADAWARAVDLLTRELRTWNYETLALAFNQAADEIPPKAAAAMRARIGQLARENAGRRAVAAAKKLDKDTRAGLRALIGPAAEQYAKNPSPAILRQLATKIRGQIGITAKQARYIGRWEKAARKAGMPERAIMAAVKRKSEAAITFRARAIGNRGVAEAVGWGRHQLWLEALDAGLLPDTIKKQWRDQRDGRERESHRRQTIQGPIPLEEPYPIQGVMHPPSRDEGCRCWQELVWPKN